MKQVFIAFFLFIAAVSCFGQTYAAAQAAARAGLLRTALDNKKKLFVAGILAYDYLSGKHELYNVREQLKGIAANQRIAEHNAGLRYQHLLQEGLEHRKISELIAQGTLEKKYPELYGQVKNIKKPSAMIEPVPLLLMSPFQTISDRFKRLLPSQEATSEFVKKLQQDSSNTFIP